MLEIKDAANDHLLDGFYKLSNTDYHGGDGYGSSNLRDILRSPAHYQYAKKNPMKSKAFDFGNAVHCAILEPDLFNDQFIELPDFPDRRTKAGKEAYKEFEEFAKGLIILDKYDFQAVNDIRVLALEHDRFGPLLGDSHNHFELSAFKECPNTGVLRKVRPDIYNPKHNIIIDLKTTDNASYYPFKATINKYNYHIQAAYYVDVIRDITGKEPIFAYAAIEKKQPFGIGLYTIGPRTLELGRIEYKKALNVLGECLAKDEWPGYDTNFINIDLPDYLLGEI